MIMKCLVLLLATLAAMPLAAQDRPQRRGGPGERVSPAEIQQLFDAYVIMQAQKVLQLTDEQYPQFLGRVKALQSARQRGLAERIRILRDIRRLADAASVDDGQARTQLKALADLDARTESEVRDALAGVDEVLDVRQQLRFRLFEEQMERRKVELLMRARQGR